MHRTYKAIADMGRGRRMETYIAIQRAQIKDVADIIYIMEQVVSFISNPSWFVADDMEFVTRHLENEGFILLAFIHETPAGFLIIRTPKEALDNLGQDLEMPQEEFMLAAHMESVAVLPQFRGLEVARKLLIHGEERLKQKGYRHLLATVHPDNLASLHNFEKLDYHIKKKVLKYGGKERLIVYKQIRGTE